MFSLVKLVERTKDILCMILLPITKQQFDWQPLTKLSKWKNNTQKTASEGNKDDCLI